MTQNAPLDLKRLEPQLVELLPSRLIDRVRTEPADQVLERIFEHLRTLQRILQDYVPRHVSDSPPVPGKIRYNRWTGTILFSDLVDFTPAMEAAAAQGRQGAEKFLKILNAYFAAMAEILSKSGGELLEFGGDALLAYFPADPNGSDTARAVRAGLRMQRAMDQFVHLALGAGDYSLKMRVGIHFGSFLSADVGTPARMEHVHLGRAVYDAKLAETNGQAGRVCLTETARARVAGYFSFEPVRASWVLVSGLLSSEALGDYDMVLPHRRVTSPVLWDRSQPGMVVEIERLIGHIQPLACYLPRAILKLVVESADQRKIPPQFPVATVLIANLGGLVEAFDKTRPEEVAAILETFSQTFSIINTAVESWGGILKKITYQKSGSNVMIFFGVPDSNGDHPVQAVNAALALREVFRSLEATKIQGQSASLGCRIGIANGLIFAGEVGEPHGRREYTILGDTANTAARLTDIARPDQILTTREVSLAVPEMNSRVMGGFSLKGKTAPLEIYEVK